MCQCFQDADFRLLECIFFVSWELAQRKRQHGVTLLVAKRFSYKTALTKTQSKIAIVLVKKRRFVDSPLGS